jgi:hypothetical protein
MLARHWRGPGDMRPSLPRRLRDASGANLVETALILPVALLLTFSLIEFATLFFVFLALESGVSQATRYAVTGQVVSGNSREDSIRQAMRDATPTLSLADDAFAFTHLPVGGQQWLSGPGGPRDIAKVTVTYSFPFVSPLVRAFFTDGRLPLVVESTMKNEPLFE